MMESIPFDFTDNDALAYLHKCGIKLTGLDDFGMTPLHNAVLYAKVPQVVALVKLGFDASVPDSRGITALDLAKGILDDSLRKQILNALDSQP